MLVYQRVNKKPWAIWEDHNPPMEAAAERRSLSLSSPAHSDSCPEHQDSAEIRQQSHGWGRQNSEPYIYM